MKFLLDSFIYVMGMEAGVTGRLFVFQTQLVDQGLFILHSRECQN